MDFILGHSGTLDGTARAIAFSVTMKPLTAKQEAFAKHYAMHRNGAGAYRHAYDVAEQTSDQTCAEHASRLLADDKVAARIEAIIAEATRIAATTPPAPGEEPTPEFTIVECLKTWLEIATADANELISLKVGCCRHCYGEGFGYQWVEGEYLEQLRKYDSLTRRGVEAELPDIGGGFDFDKTLEPNPDCPRCRGEGVERFVPRDTTKLSAQARRLYGGVKVKRDGYEIIIADQQKALENASRIIGAFTDNVRLGGSISAAVAAVSAQYAAATPQEAAKAYQDFIRNSASVNG